MRRTEGGPWQRASTWASLLRDRRRGLSMPMVNDSTFQFFRARGNALFRWSWVPVSAKWKVSG
jgi:hypothetical protein